MAKGGLDVLVDQSDDFTSGIVSQVNIDTPDFDVFNADDFTVPDGMTWTVLQVRAGGFYSANAGNPEPAAQCLSADIGFWTSAGATPDMPFALLEDVAVANDDAGDLTFDVEATELPAGTYWLSVQCSGTLNFDTVDTDGDAVDIRRWNWFRNDNNDATGGAGETAVIRNDGGAFGFPATWNSFDDIGLTAGFDLNFVLSGTSEGGGGGGGDMYTFTDSNDDGGPTYDFTDISGTGTLLTGFDDEACTFGDLDEGNVDVTLPFAFPFYGADYSQVTVNVNGLLVVSTPDPLGCAFGNDPLPDAGDPNGGLIAPLWDDYNATPNAEGGPNAGDIYVQEVGGAFVIQYNEIERFGGAQDGLTNTFQVALYPNGDILYQYGALNGTGFSYSIGIENLDGTEGLQVNEDSEYAAEGLAVLITMGGGTGGDQVSFPITFDDPDVDYEIIDFPDDGSGPTSMIVTDPEDATNMVVQSVYPEMPACFAGTTVAGTNGFDMPIPFEEGETKLNVRVWSPEVGVRVRLKVEQFDDPTVSVEVDEFTTVAMEWETIEYDFANEVPGTAEINFDSDYTKVSIFFGFSCDVDGGASGGNTYYWDDLRFGAADGTGGDGALTFDPNPLVEMLMSGETGTETVTVTNTTDMAVAYDFAQYSDAARPAAAARRDVPTARELGLQKGDVDPRPSYTPLRGEGGPDAFGYQWIDSNEPGGPAFEAIDISSTGTELLEGDFDPEGCTFGPLDEGNALVELPFTFSFYDEDYTSVKVNINGLLNFNADGGELPCQFTNDPLPDPGAPNGGLIAPLWDDYDASDGGGRIFYETLGDGRFVVQWTDIQPFANDTDLNTFQAILSPSGSIKFQYVSLGSPTPSYSIGIENADGTVGLEVAMGSGYAEDGLAVLISAAPTFVTDVDPATGTIPAGGSVDVDVTFDATGLNGGTYEGTLVVETDLEGEDSTFELPVVLVVTGLAECTLSVDGDFDDTIVGNTAEVEATVTNDGTDSCSLTAASATGPFTVEGFDPTVLAPGQSTTFTVVFTPTEAGDATGTLTVVLDGKDDLTAELSATGQDEPTPEVDPTSFTFEVDQNEQDSDSFTITNVGGADAADLEYEISVVEARPAPGGDQARAGSGASGVTFRTGRDGAAKAATAGTLRTRFEAAVARQGATANRGDAGFTGPGYVPFEGEAPVVTGPFGTSRSGGGVTITHSASQDIAFGTNIGCQNAGGTVANSWFRVFDLSAFEETAGGGLNVTSVDIGTEGTLSGDFETSVNLYTLDGTAGTTFPLSSLTLVSTTTFTVTAGNLNQVVNVPITGEFGPEDVLVVEWMVPDATPVGGFIFAGYNTAGQTDETYILAPDCGASDPTDLGQLVPDPLAWVLNVNGAAGLQLVSVDPEEGTLAPGESDEITILVDATDVEPGTYDYELLIETNDPSTPTVTVDVTVVVKPVVANEDGAIPTEFVVEQNYPNPFGASTAIRYGLAEAGPVEVSVYDAVGRLVATLVDQEQGAGYHTAQWDARGVASGLYVYRVTAGAHTRTLKMTLVR